MGTCARIYTMYFFVIRIILKTLKELYKNDETDNIINIAKKLLTRIQIVID